MSKLSLKAFQKAIHDASKKAIELDQSLGLPIIVVRDNIMFKQEPNGKETCLGRCTFGTIKVRKLKHKNI